VAAEHHIGTSGWNYGHWKGPFYPDDMRDPDFLEYYKDRFDTVEINNSFYNLPSEKTLVAWKNTVTEDFIFAVKASRYITHMKKLKDPDEPLDNFMKRIEALGTALGPILFQLPPKWNCNTDRLDEFLETLPQGHRYTMEFRDQSWWNDDVYEALRSHNVAFCIFDLAGTRSPKELTADFAYLRLHGPGDAYEGRYGKKRLSGWAGAFNAWNDKVSDIYCYFDNDQDGYAALDAADLKEMLNPG
jgi:uncharacterized protein YecE (DUF72 family)